MAISGNRSSDKISSLDTEDTNWTTIDTIPIPSGDGVEITTKILARVPIFPSDKEYGNVFMIAIFRNYEGTVDQAEVTVFLVNNLPSLFWTDTEVKFLISSENVLIQVKGIASLVNWVCKREALFI